MADNSKIQWTDATWNVVTGCTKVSPGCAHCYIERSPPFRIAGRKFEQGRIPLVYHENRLQTPLTWKRPRRVFVNSLSDLFHEDVPDNFIDKVFAIMALAYQHRFQILTKRPDRMKQYLDPSRWAMVEVAGSLMGYGFKRRPEFGDWPLPNVWLGVTAENQRFANERIPLLLQTPAAVRFVSLEPLLGPIDLVEAVNRLDMLDMASMKPGGLDWVIVGGESAGPDHRSLVLPGVAPGSMKMGSAHYPKVSALESVRRLRNQSVAAGVPFFFKQWGGPRPHSGGRLLDGREWNEMPA